MRKLESMKNREVTAEEERVPFYNYPRPESRLNANEIYFPRLFATRNNNVKWK